MASVMSSVSENKEIICYGFTFFGVHVRVDQYSNKVKANLLTKILLVSYNVNNECFEK